MKRGILDITTQYACGASGACAPPFMRMDGPIAHWSSYKWTSRMLDLVHLDQLCAGLAEDARGERERAVVRRGCYRI
eukprot:3930376-Pyramimonas_sp.AAC.2